MKKVLVLHRLTWQKSHVQDLLLVLVQVGHALAGQAPFLAAFRAEVAEDKLAVLRQDGLGSISLISFCRNLRTKSKYVKS
jgi:hypothetical protein